MSKAIFNEELDSDGVPIVTPQQVKEKAAEIKVIDVRRPEELRGELGRIKASVHSQLQTDLDEYLNSLPKNDTYVFICRSGNRSGLATHMAKKKGLQNVFNMKGGMLAWNALGFEVEKN